MARLKPCPFEVRTFQHPLKPHAPSGVERKADSLHPSEQNRSPGAPAERKARVKAEAEYLRCSCALEIDVFFEATA